MRFYNYLIYCFLSIIVYSSCVSSKNYNIAVTPKTINKGDTLYMTAYNGRTLVPVDTEVVNELGTVYFTGKKKLPSGMYSIGKSEDNNFDFLLSDKQPQQFTVSYDTANIHQSLDFTGSAENTEFTRYWNTGTPDKNINYKKYPTLDLYMRIVDDNIADENNKDSIKKHYLDNIDFTNEHITRMPVLDGKLYKYFFQVLDMLDTAELKKGVDNVLSKALYNIDVYNFCTTAIYELFIYSPLPGHEKIVEYLSKQYILPNECSVVFDSTFITRVKAETNWLNLTQVGSIAPDLKLQSISGDYVRLSDIKAKAIAIFFLDPDCGICQEIAPTVYKLYQTYKNKGFEVYAVYPGYEENKWKNYIISHKFTDWINVWTDEGPHVAYSNYSIMGLPTIFLLDEEKRIISKDILVNELSDFLKKME